MISIEVGEGAVTREGRDAVDVGSATSGKDDDAKVTVGRDKDPAFSVPVAGITGIV